MDEILDREPEEPKYKPERPLLITILCVLLALGSIISVIRMVPFMLNLEWTWHQPHQIISLIVGIVSMVGLWQMKRWAVYLYTGIAVINQAILIVVGAWSFYPLIIIGVFIVLLFTQFHKME